MSERHILAFPFDHPPIQNGDPSADRQLGMTLRDYFAAAALIGFGLRAGSPLAAPDSFAQEAYLCADAMLKERAK